MGSREALRFRLLTELTPALNQVPGHLFFERA